MKHELSKRDYIAIEIMKETIKAQLRYGRMGIISRIGFYFNLGYIASFDYNMPDIAKKSYQSADIMIKESPNPPIKLTEQRNESRTISKRIKIRKSL